VAHNIGQVIDSGKGGLTKEKSKQEMKVRKGP
jgi:hypothetical protein